MSFRQLTPEEEKLEGTVWSRWEMFLYHMQESSEFVAGQTPVVSQTLDDKYQVRFMTTCTSIYCHSVQPTKRIGTMSLYYVKLSVIWSTQCLNYSKFQRQLRATFITEHSILNEKNRVFSNVLLSKLIGNLLFPFYKTSGSHTKFEKVSYS